jgi:hypothetical protein
LLGANKRQCDAYAPKDRVVNEAGCKNNLAPSELNLMAFAVREGRANKDDARALLTLFCECVEHRLILARNPVADRLLEHVREAFRAYLDGDRNIESALGLVGKKGRLKADARRNEADEKMRMQMAADVLRHRLNAMSHQDALAMVEQTFGWGQTTISEAWASYKSSALILVRIDRGSVGFTSDEIAQLCAIFGGEEWFIASEKSPISPE